MEKVNYTGNTLSNWLTIVYFKLSSKSREVVIYLKTKFSQVKESCCPTLSLEIDQRKSC